jgi:hypothetical protein
MVQKASHPLAIILCAALLMSVLHVPISHAESMVSDEYVRGFVDRDYVTYKDDRLVLHAKPDIVEMIWELHRTLSAAIMLLNCDRWRSRSSGGERNVAWGLEALFFYWGLLEGSMLCADLYRRCKRTPYITLDKNGLMIGNDYCLRWAEVYCEVGEVTESNQILLRRTRKISLVDRNKSNVFILSDRDRYMPLSFESIVVLIKYYLEKYGKK